MATTTPNFGWPVPTSTDLVKNGATAIEALGDAIDASMVDLEGGTTGQVLAKASNTDMDFAWVTTDDANAIQNAIVNAKGDIIGASANDVPAITSVGNNGEALYADSAATAGLRYSATPAASNPVINSSMQVAQRGTTFSFSGSGGYSLDRWYVNSFPASTITQQLTGDTTNLPFIQYCARVQRNAGNTSTGSLSYSQSFETINSRPFAGKTVTVSFYARKGANYSPTSSFVDVLLRSGTGTDQNIHGTYTGVATVVSASVALTTTWQRFTTSLTGTVAATATELAVTFASNSTGTAGAADYFEVTGVQIDIGSVALPFRTAGVSYQEELAMCQRYYYRAVSSAAGTALSTASPASTTTVVDCLLPVPVTMRTTPTSVETSAVSVTDSVTNYSTGTWSMAAALYGTQIMAIRYTHGTAALTQFRPYFVQATTSSGYIGLSAEL
jgi:hypothetical protein